MDSRDAHNAGVMLASLVDGWHVYIKEDDGEFVVDLIRKNGSGSVKYYRRPTLFAAIAAAWGSTPINHKPEVVVVDEREVGMFDEK